MSGDLHESTGDNSGELPFTDKGCNKSLLLLCGEWILLTSDGGDDGG